MLQEFFQELISIVLHNMKDFTLAYLDDMIIFSPTIGKHIEHIQLVFNSLRNHEIKLKLAMYKVLEQQMQYLGFIISNHGIMAHPD